MTYSIGPVLGALRSMRSPLQGYYKKAPGDASEAVEGSADGIKRLATKGPNISLQENPGLRHVIVPVDSVDVKKQVKE